MSNDLTHQFTVTQSPQQVYDAMWQPTYPELVFDGD